MRSLNWFAISAGIILGLIFLAAGLGKLLNPMDSSIIFVFPEFLPNAVDKFIYQWLPYVEIIIGVLLITGIIARLTASLALVLTLGLIASNSIMLVQGLGDKPCGCFGEAERLAQLSLSVTGALYIDIAMLILGFMVLLFYQSRFFNITPWFLRRD